MEICKPRVSGFHEQAANTEFTTLQNCKHNTDDWVDSLLLFTHPCWLEEMPLLSDRAGAFSETVINSFAAGQTQPELLRETFEALQCIVFVGLNSISVLL